MLDDIKDLFRDGLQYTHTAGILQQVANLINIVQTQYMKDEDSKNTALDLICKLLQSHKDVTITNNPKVKCLPTQAV
jgi:hypothetical protein